MNKIKLGILFLLLMFVVTSCNTMSDEREEWIIEKAKEGDAESQYLIVTSQDYNYFRSVDGKTRERYLESLLEQAYVPAMVHKAEYSKNIKEKISWLEKAAEKGSSRAMLNLYKVYSSEKYKNEALADKWLREAEAEGDKQARDWVRELDGIEVGWWCSIKETIQDGLSYAKGSGLAGFAVMIFNGAIAWLIGGLSHLLSFGSTWWIGLLLLLGLLLFIALFAVAYYFYEQYDTELSIDDQSSLSWLMLIYVVWGFLSCVASYISIEFAYNVGHFWLVEGTFGFWAKFAVCLSWIALIFTLLAIWLCYVSTKPKKRKIRLLLLVLINVYCFVMGAFLSLLAVIGVALLICNIAFWDNVKSGIQSAPKIIYDRMVVGVDGLIRSARSLGGNRFEDKEGNTYKQTDFNEFEKE